MTDTSALPPLSGGWDYLQISIPVDRTKPVDVERVAAIAADAARHQLAKDDPS